MIGYRFLFAAEKEMTEAAVFYEAASIGLGTDFLEDLQQVLTCCGPIQKSASAWTPT